jgi:hydroxyacylglutathione hydrolase
MRIVPVPCLKDNYAYLVICEQTGQAAVVDPSEADPVLAAAAREGVTLTAVWNTHHHWDHTGGNERLVKAHPELAVVAHASDKGRVPGQTVFAEEGDEVSVGEEATARVIHNPGHTTGAVSFYLASAPAVFTGDTLFCAGCGRLFEGTPADMHASLAKLAALPADTRVFCGHEYTAANLVFAAAVEPDNAAVAERTKKVVAARAAGEPSVPSTIAEEKATNPFMRSEVEAVARAARAHEPDATTPSEVLGAIRRWKDRF